MTNHDHRPSHVLAQNLRQHRHDRDLSLADLAQRSQVAKATLSQIEAGKGNPRLETLVDIAEALGVSVADLLESDAASATVVVRAGDGVDISDSAIGGRLVRGLTMPATVSEFYVLDLEPGTRVVSSSHGVGAQDHVLVLSGRLRAGPVRAPVEAAAGDYIGYASDEPHVWEALNDEPARAWVLQAMPTSRG